MQPDFEAIGRALENAEPIKMNITPYRAFCLVSLLHLTLRHPQLREFSPGVYEVATSMIRNLTAKLGEIKPEIAAALNQGWDESLDMTPAEYKQFARSNDLPQRNYSQLRPDIQQEVIANSIALGIACNALAQMTGTTQNAWANQISRQANELTDQMTEEAIKEEIQRIDFTRDFGG